VIGDEGEEVLLLTAFLHQMTMTCHWASVVCDKEYVWHLLLLLVLLLFVVFLIVEASLSVCPRLEY
jgi:hypothetical protein